MIQLKECGFTQQSLCFNSSSNGKEDIKYYLSFGRIAVKKEGKRGGEKKKERERQTKN